MSKSSKNRDLFGRATLADAGLTAKVAPKRAPTATLMSEVGAIGLLFARTFRALFTAKTDAGDTFRLAHRYTNGAATFIIISMAFVGMIMVYQSTEQLLRAIGDTQLVGPAFIKLLVRVLGPTIIGMLIACRVGAGIAAELGAMKVTEQLDAMRICSADPIEVLMVPRVRAGIISSLTLVVIGSAASATAGFATAVVLYSMNTGTFWNLNMIGVADVAQGMFKALTYGMVVPIIAGAFGFRATGGARGVGQATTDAVVGASFAIVLLDSIISILGYVFGG